MTMVEAPRVIQANMAGASGHHAVTPVRTARGAAKTRPRAICFVLLCCAVVHCGSGVALRALSSDLAWRGKGVT